MGRAIWELFYFQLFQKSGDFAWSSVRSCLSLETMHDPKEPVLLIAFKITRHAKLCLLVIMFLICACWHPDRKDVQGTVFLWAEGASLTC